jgi:hypothetical protein
MSIDVVFKKLGIVIEPDANALPLDQDLNQEIRELVNSLLKISQERAVNPMVNPSSLWMEFIPWNSLN